MSAYVTGVTEFKDRDALVAALAECGFPCEVFESAINLVGISGDKRPELANVVIRRQHVGNASNEVGFLLDPATGRYTATISEYDASWNFGPVTVAKVKRAYATNLLIKEAQRKGFRVSRSLNAKGETQLECRRMVNA